MSWAADVKRVPPDWEDANPYWESVRFTRDDLYMPSWRIEECTHYQFWQTKVDPTPVSPTFSTPEEMAAYLIENESWPWFEVWAHVYRKDPAKIADAIRKEGEEYLQSPEWCDRVIR